MTGRDQDSESAHLIVESSEFLLDLLRPAHYPDIVYEIFEGDVTVRHVWIILELLDAARNPGQYAQEISLERPAD